MFNNNPRDRGNLMGTSIRDNYYNNAPTPAMFIENMKDHCLFDKNTPQNIYQNNNVNYDNSIMSDNRGFRIEESNYINRPLIDNNINDEVRNEYIDERDIIIDTIDRNTSTYPNIFDFTLKLGSTDTTVGPFIHRDIKNVKYIKLVKALLPDNYYVLNRAASSGDTTLNSWNTGSTNYFNNNHYDTTDDTTTPTFFIIHYPLLRSVQVSDAGHHLYNLGTSTTLFTSNLTITNPSLHNMTIVLENQASQNIDLKVDDVIELTGTTNYNFRYKILTLISEKVPDPRGQAPINNPIYQNDFTYKFTFTVKNKDLTGKVDETSGTILKYPNAVRHEKFTVDFFKPISGGTTPDYSKIYQAEWDDVSNYDENASTFTVADDANRYWVYSKDQDSQIEKGRFFQLHIDQLPKNNDLSTSSSVRNSFSLLYPSKEDDRGFNTLNGMETDKIFKFSNLGNFSNISIKILDSTGKLLETNKNIWNLSLDNLSNPGQITNTGNTKSQYRYSFRSASKYFRHPLAWAMQAQFIFTIGEVHLEINKKTFN